MTNKMYTPEVQSRISTLRAKALANTLTREEMKEAVILLRQGRSSAVAASAAGKTRAKASRAPVNVDAQLDELMKM